MKKLETEKDVKYATECPKCKSKVEMLLHDKIRGNLMNCQNEECNHYYILKI